MYGTARLSPRTREFLVERAAIVGVARTAREAHVSRRTVYRWCHRAPDFRDRSSRPHRSPRRTRPELEAAVLELRREERAGPDVIAARLRIPASTVHRILRRYQAHRLAHLFPRPPLSRGRFEVGAPGELVAIDTKQLGRLERGGGRRAVMHRSHAGVLQRVGWRHLYVAIDFASRVIYTELRDSDVAPDSTAFLDAAVAHFDALGIRVRRVLTDNGNGYKRRFHEHCQALGLRHSRIRPRHPWTNGRVERVIGTVQRECLYAGAFFTSEDERALALWHWRAYYNGERPHMALGGLTPMEWLLQRRNATQVPRDLI